MHRAQCLCDDPINFRISARVIGPNETTLQTTGQCNFIMVQIDRTGCQFTFDLLTDGPNRLLSIRPIRCCSVTFCGVVTVFTAERDWSRVNRNVQLDEFETACLTDYSWKRSNNTRSKCIFFNSTTLVYECILFTEPRTRTAVSHTWYNYWRSPFASDWSFVTIKHRSFPSKYVLGSDSTGCTRSLQIVIRSRFVRTITPIHVDMTRLRRNS